MNDEVTEAFKYFDTVGDSTIAVSEVGACLRVLGHAPTEEQVNHLILSWNNKPDTRISVEEFVPMVASMEKESTGKTFQEKDFAEAFGQLDTEGSGLIHAAQLKFMLMHMGERMSQDQVEQTLFGMIDNEGNVDIDKYVARMCDRDAKF